MSHQANLDRIKARENAGEISRQRIIRMLYDEAAELIRHIESLERELATARAENVELRTEKAQLLAIMRAPSGR